MTFTVRTEYLEDFQEVLDHLKKKHVRITESRKAITAYIIESDRHPSAEMIYRDLLPDYPNMSLATVYNNLKLLVEEGFVAEIKRNNDPTTYFDFMGHNHLNLICEKCDKILDLHISIPSIRQEIELDTGFQVTKEIHSVHGICPECQSTHS